MTAGGAALVCHMAAASLAPYWSGFQLWLAATRMSEDKWFQVHWMRMCGRWRPVLAELTKPLVVWLSCGSPLGFLHLELVVRKKNRGWGHGSSTLLENKSSRHKASGGFFKWFFSPNDCCLMSHVIDIVYSNPKVAFHLPRKIEFGARNDFTILQRYVCKLEKRDERIYCCLTQFAGERT